MPLPPSIPPIVNLFVLNHDSAIEMCGLDYSRPLGEVEAKMLSCAETARSHGYYNIARTLLHSLYQNSDDVQMQRFAHYCFKNSCGYSPDTRYYCDSEVGSPWSCQKHPSAPPEEQEIQCFPSTDTSYDHRLPALAMGLAQIFGSFAAGIGDCLLESLRGLIS